MPDVQFDEGGDNLIGYHGAPRQSFGNPYAPIGRSSGRPSGITGLVMKIGLAKTQEKATVVMVIMMIIFFSASIYFFFFSGPPRPKSGSASMPMPTEAMPYSYP